MAPALEAAAKVHAQLLAVPVIRRTFINIIAAVAVSDESLVALAEVGADNVATVGVGVTAMSAGGALVLIFTISSVASKTSPASTAVTPDHVLTNPDPGTDIRILLTFIYIGAGES